MRALRLLLTVVSVSLALTACGDLDEFDGTVCDALGDEGCPCRDDGGCNVHVDGTLLVCVSGRCELPPMFPADDSCPAGDLGCDCLPGDVCSAGAQGSPLACTDGVCRDPDCLPGAQACVCDALNVCEDGSICDDGWCVANTGQTLDPPADPKCWTPCRGGGLVQPDGSFAACSADGLVAGCTGDATCVRGSCVVPRVAGAGDGDGDGDGDDLPDIGVDTAAVTVELPVCASGAQCPDHQNCIDGGCYSDCQADDDCNSPRVCDRMSCRLPCDVGGAACPDDHWCDSSDGVTGVCMPAPQTAELSIAPPPAIVVPPPQFELAAPQVVRLTDRRRTAEIVLTNPGPTPLTFTIHKSRHTEHTNYDATVVTAGALPWLALGGGGAPLDLVSELAVDVPPGGRTPVSVAAPADQDPAFPRWEGILTIRAPGLAATDVTVWFAASPAGKWVGRAYYFANFGTAHLDAWRDALQTGGPDAADTEIPAVGNALIRRWWGFRQGIIPRDEFDAAVRATIDQTWRWPVSKRFCANDNAACYPSDNLLGFSVFSDDLAASPVPTGVSFLDVALDLQSDPDDPLLWQGRIDSGVAMQYPGDPELTVRLASDPNDCWFDSSESCLTAVTELTAETAIGGRFPSNPEDADCAAAGDERFEQLSYPWLVPGFTRGTSADETGARRRYECRDTWLPLGADEADKALNASLAAANPLPDGVSLRPRLELLDGALINGDDLFVIFRERLPALFAGGEASSVAYGFMQLNRAIGPEADDSTEFAGAVAPGDPETPDLPEATCASWLIDTLFEADDRDRVTAGLADRTLLLRDVRRLVQGSLSGVITDNAPTPIDDHSRETVHWLCHDTGYIDGPETGHGFACPPGSKITYFTSKPGPTQEGPEFLADPLANIDELPCNSQQGECRPGEPCAASEAVYDCGEDEDGTPGEGTCLRVGGGCETGPDAPLCRYKGACDTVLAGWIEEYEALPEDRREAHWFRPDPSWRCADPDDVTCQDDRADLTADRIFYEREEVAPVFRPLRQEIDDAFRYKTRFQSRLSNKSVGFAPQVCDGDAVPYCYDPPAIDGIADRVDCLAFVYSNWFDTLDSAAFIETPDPLLPELEPFLVRNYAYTQTFEPGKALPAIHHGFEHLFAELLVMLGDEAYTSSFASRFDLAGQMIASFEGSAFEPDGLDLAGTAGFELFTLYQAAQYYQLVMDRFLSQRPTIAATLAADFAGERLITATTAVSWFSKLILASSRKARTWAAIARKYHEFGRPAPARRVVEKAYVTTYLESIYFSQLMKLVLDRAAGTEKAQVEAEIETAQLVYKDALLQMSNLRRTITDDLTIFGFPPTYVPFPPLDPGDPNAFERMLERAREVLQTAAAKEVTALASTREFDTDAAEFQSELKELELDRTGQLGELCGWFQVQTPDGPEVYPATAEFAHLADDERIRLLGDPCGLVGNGQIHEALLELRKAEQAVAQWQQRYANLLQAAEDEQDRVDEQCDRIDSFADWRVGEGEDAIKWTGVQAAGTAMASTMDRIRGEMAYTSEKMECLVIVGFAAGTNCPQKAVSATFYAAISAVTFAAATAGDLAVELSTIKLKRIEEGIAEREIREECDEAEIDTKFVIKGYMRDLAELTLEGLQLATDIELAASQVQSLRNLAICVEATKQEQTRLTIDIEAARNDPNIRIYKNDDILAADRSFNRAVREAYRATRVFEYFTNTEYAFADQLPLVRMVAHGDFPLDAYLDELDDAFFDWEDRFGNPDLRVDVISVADDVFQVPRVDRGAVLTPVDQAREFNRRLDEAPLTEDGYLQIDFRTSLDRLSPLTHNHKIRFVEVELVGTDLGDDLGRAYVRQSGDGVGFVLEADGGKRPYSFPQRTAVVNTSFNGERPLQDALGILEGSTVPYYRSERLRDRPLHHSGWQLLLNFRDEDVNLDIRREGLRDIKLYLWYTDFTEL